jgi:hypothetical protein
LEPLKRFGQSKTSITVGKGIGHSWTNIVTQGNGCHGFPPGIAIYRFSVRALGP